MNPWQITSFTYVDKRVRTTVSTIGTCPITQDLLLSKLSRDDIVLSLFSALSRIQCKCMLFSRKKRRYNHVSYVTFFFGVFGFWISYQDLHHKPSLSWPEVCSVSRLECLTALWSIDSERCSTCITTWFRIPMNQQTLRNIFIEGPQWKPVRLKSSVQRHIIGGNASENAGE